VAKRNVAALAEVWRVNSIVGKHRIWVCVDKFLDLKQVQSVYT